MIGLPAGTRIWLAAGVTDMRAGMNGLATKAQTALAEDPFSGHVFLFRGRRGDIDALKALLLASERLVRERDATIATQGDALLNMQAQLTTRGAEIEHLPRDVKEYLPPSDACPACGGGLRHLGEDVAEQLEFTPASFRVVRHVRPTLACACCDTIVQAAAPSRPIERGIAGPGLLAHVLAHIADHPVKRVEDFLPWNCDLPAAL